MFRLLNLVVCTLTFASYLGSYLHPYTFWPFAFLGLFFPLLALANVGWIGYWLLTQKHKRWAWMSAVTLLAGWPHLGGLFGIHVASLAKQEGIRVLSYNVRRFQPYKEESKSMISAAEWRENLEAYQPDILCVQEYDRSTKLEPADICREVGLPHQFRIKGNELGIFSRFPIEHSESHLFNNLYGYQFADISMDGRMVRVFNVHLQSNGITGIASRVAENGSFGEKRTWLDIRGMLSRYRKAARVRTEQTALIMKALQESPYPVLLCGDLNDVPQSYVYHQLNSLLDDAFKKAGWGIGITYAGPIPGLRIDTILVDSVLKIKSCRIGRTEFSDHHPVLAVVAWE